MPTRIKFTCDCDNYVKDQVVELDDGIADAYATYRRTAVFVKPEDSEAVKAMSKRRFETERKDKAMGSEVVTKK